MMPRKDAEDSVSKSSGKTVTFDANIPIVHSISGNLLEGAGFIRDKLEYVKGDVVIKYDGVHWWQNGDRIQFMEDIKY